MGQFVQAAKFSSVVFRVNRLDVSFADLYRQHSTEPLSLYIVSMQAETGVVEICLAPLAGKTASQQIVIYVCLGASGIVHFILGEELLLKEHELSSRKGWI